MRFEQLRFIPLVMLVAFQCVVGQTGVFFPQTPFRWSFTTTILDSLNRPVDSLRYVTHEEYKSTRVVGGKNAFVIERSTIGIDESVVDTSFVAIENGIGYEYIDLLGNLDASVFPDSFDLSFLGRIGGWYPLYNFTAPINVTTILLSFDTTLVFDTTVVPISVRARTMRLQDAAVLTQGSVFQNAKRFVTTLAIGQNIGIFGFLTFLAITDTVFIAEGHWIVKRAQPSAIPLLSLLFPETPSFYIPGRVKELTLATSVERDNVVIPAEYISLSAYPNPFNPSTNIQIRSAHSGFTVVEVYDMRGNRIQRMEPQFLSSGTSTVKVEMSGQPSGTYLLVVRRGSEAGALKIVMLK